MCSDRNKTSAMLQEWRDLCFLHFPIDPAKIRAMVPPELALDVWPDEFGTPQAWIGIVTFSMQNIRFPGGPALPWISAFLETNVRTYVRYPGGDSGVWFFTLDASRWLACEYAKARFALKYLHAEMHLEKVGDTMSYRIRRLEEPHGELDLSYQIPDVFQAASPHTFEHWLVERYTLFTVLHAELHSGKVVHPPYRIAPVVEYKLKTNLPESISITQTRIQHVVYSPGVNVAVMPLARVPR